MTLKAKWKRLRIKAICAIRGHEHTSTVFECNRCGKTWPMVNNEGW